MSRSYFFLVVAPTPEPAKPKSKRRRKEVAVKEEDTTKKENSNKEEESSPKGKIEFIVIHIHARNKVFNRLKFDNLHRYQQVHRCWRSDVPIKISRLLLFLA